jgi:hypothetical protein
MCVCMYVCINRLFVLCMCVCVCMYVCVKSENECVQGTFVLCMYVCMYVCMYTYTHECMHACAHTMHIHSKSTCIILSISLSFLPSNSYTYTQMPTYTHIKCIYIPSLHASFFQFLFLSRPQVCIHTHTWSHIKTHTHTHIRTKSSMEHSLNFSLSLLLKLPQRLLFDSIFLVLLGPIHARHGPVYLSLLICVLEILCRFVSLCVYMYVHLYVCMVLYMLVMALCICLC